MKSTFYPAPGFASQLRAAFAGVEDWTNVAATVGLVEGEFDPTLPDTYPETSTHFAEKVSGIGATVQYDVATEKWFLNWPDPVGGWEFPAISITTPVTITGFTVISSEDNVLGAATIEPVTATLTGQVIRLPEVSLEIPTEAVIPADLPLNIE